MGDWIRTGLVVGLGLAFVPGAGAECLTPVLERVFPPEIRVRAGGESRPITLFGEDLGFDPVWRNPAESSRCQSRIWVRPEGGDEADWRVAAGPPSSVEVGEGGRGWVRVNLSDSSWLAEPGWLECLVVRGMVRADGSLLESGRSAIHRIGVVDEVSYPLSINRLSPVAVPPGSSGASVTLEGTFTWETEVWVNGERMAGAVVQPGEGRIGLVLTADQVSRPGRLVVRLGDAAGAVSNEVAFHVEAPTVVERASPQRLKPSRDRQTVRIKFAGAEPERVEIRFQAEAGTTRTAMDPQKEDFSEGFAKGRQVRSEAVEAGSPATVWRTVGFRIEKAEVRFAVDSEHVPGPGMLVIRLTGRTGERAALIPVGTEAIGPVMTPTVQGGPPEKDHNFTERPKY